MSENVFLADVMNQSKAMVNASAYYRTYTAIINEITKLNPKQILLTGMGSSHFCNYSPMILLNQAGIRTRVEAASEILHYESRALEGDVLLVLISQSGESGEIVDIIHKLPKEQKIVGITNNINSTLGKRADFCLEMHVEPELAVSTRTYLSSLILLDMLAAGLRHESITEALDNSLKAIQELEAFLKNQEKIQASMSDFLGYPNTVCYIARGFSLSTAECGALFTRETAKYPALAFDSGEFRHGPYEMVDKDFRAIVFAPEGNTLQLQKNITEAIASHNGKVVFVTDTEVSFNNNNNILVIRHGFVDERYAPIIEVAIPQLFANYMAIHRGFAPGVFRQSSKITTAQ